MRWLILRLLATLPTQAAIVVVSGPKRCAAIAPRSWDWFDLGGAFWLIFWSFILPRIESRKVWQAIAMVAVALPLVLLPFHALRETEATASSLGHVIAFLSANGAGYLAARFGRTRHLLTCVLYFAIFVALFALEFNAFYYLQVQAGKPGAC